MSTPGAARTILDFHVVQTVPPSNLNRDDTGSPKTCTYGGVRRARVSSQSWKRAIRKDFASTLDPGELGVRTKRLVELLRTQIKDRAPQMPDADAVALAVQALKSAGISTKAPKARKGAADEALPEAQALAFLSHAQLASLAAYAVESGPAGMKVVYAKELANSQHSIDIALFGRMVARPNNDKISLDVDAACQVAHALSTHAVANEFDYYTAVDDAKQAEDSMGAGMVGVIEFNSATLYRFATLDVDQLAVNLGDRAAAVRAATTFASSMVVSMPSGKQNTFANRTLPDAVIVTLRTDQPVNFVAAFDRPVRPADGLIGESVARLAAFAAASGAAWGVEPERSWVVSAQHGAELAALGPAVGFREVLSDLDAVLTSRLVAD